MESSTIIALLSTGIAVLSLIVSSLALYFSWLKRGRLAMTKPTIVFFGHDLVPELTPKIFLRTLLQSTASRGTTIESLYAKIHVEGESKTFGVWGYGSTEVEVQGSGLYVGREGVVLNHHLLLSTGQSFAFLPGDHRVEVFARLPGKKRPLLLETLHFTLSNELAFGLDGDEGVLFELNPETQIYVGRAQSRHRAGHKNSRM